MDEALATAKAKMMQTVKEIFEENRLPLSFEIFPPKGELTYDQAYEIACDLAPLKPSFISVTCSAGGSGNSDSTNTVAEMIQGSFGIPSVAHVTCINKNQAGLNATIADLRARGIGTVLALRGDLPADQPTGREIHYPHASDLIEPLVEAGFCVGAAAYPEGHIENLLLEDDIDHLKQKQDAGASFFVTQLFFLNDLFYRFREQAERQGITVPITCGIMPFLSQAQLSRMVFMCGASLPSPIIKLLARYADDPESLKAAGIEYACEQLVDLADHGVDGLHIYTMNQVPIAHATMQALHDAGYGD